MGVDAGGDAFGRDVGGGDVLVSATALGCCVGETSVERPDESATLSGVRVGKNG